MPAAAETLKVYSPPIIDLGALPPEIEDRLNNLAEEMAKRPDNEDPYHEVGRKANRFVYGEEDNTELQVVAQEMSLWAFDQPLDHGSVGFHNIIIDPDAFNEHARQSKAAAYWHQEFMNTHAATLPIPGNRLNWSTIIGTEVAEGELTFTGPVTRLDSATVDRKRALDSGELVVGTDNLLIKASNDPVDGTLYHAPAHRAILFPRDTVHRSPLEMPKGRQFFQVDLWKRS